MLSPKQMAALALLDPREPRYGLELVDRSGGELKRGTVYAVLYALEGMGLVESRVAEQPPEAIGPPRRVYVLTGKGVRVRDAAHDLEAQLGLEGSDGRRFAR